MVYVNYQLRTSQSALAKADSKKILCIINNHKLSLDISGYP